MRVRYMVLLSVLAVGVACTACTSGATQAPTTVGRSQQPAESVQASPTVETAWFWSDSGLQAPLFRMLSFIGNPGPKALTGVELEWVAYDASNSIVGSHKTAVSAIPPGGKIPYMAGAGSGNLSGIPARAELRVVKKGSFVDTAAPAFEVSDVTFVKAESNLLYPGMDVYDVTAKVTTGSEEVASAKISAVVFLRDQAGAVVGGDIWTPENLPETVPPGSKFTIKMTYVLVTAKPASAEAFATQDP